MPAFQLQAQDLVIAVKLAIRDATPTYAVLSQELDLSASQVHAGVARARKSRLLLRERMEVNVEGLLEFLVHGLKYTCPPALGAIARGMPTAHAALPLRELVTSDEPIVWPDPEGELRGQSLQPLYPRVVSACRRDPELHGALTLVDALRVGRARERRLAEQLLGEMLGAHEEPPAAG